MVAAQLHGRTGPEDVLTGTVFGALAMLPVDVGLAPWLRGAWSFAARATTGVDLGEDYRMRFWPSLAYGGRLVEPDLVIDSPGQRLVIEVKYGARPSGMPGEGTALEGQLGRQWAAAHAGIPEDTRVALIYLTTDWSLPAGILESMCAEVERKRFPKPLREHLYWLSWRSLEGVLSSERGGLARPAARGVEMLTAFLRSRRLQTLRPARCFVSGPLRWSYPQNGQPAARRYPSEIPPTRLDWSYRT